MRYLAVTTINQLAEEFGVHRTTILSRLDRQPVPRRRTARKLTDLDVAFAAARYRDGQTLAELAEHLDISPTTLTRELRLAGVSVRRRGRPASG